VSADQGQVVVRIHSSRSGITRSSTWVVASGGITAITRRTILRKAFLAPWHELVREIWLYALALARPRPRSRSITAFS
jgi:hypothetical protein